MVTPFYYLAGLLLLSSYPTGSEPLAFARAPLLAPWAALGGLVVYAGICWAALARRRPIHPLLLEVLRLLALILFTQLVFVFHFPLWISDMGVEDPLASSLLSLLPLFALNAILALLRSRVDPHGGGLRLAFRLFVGLSFLPILFILLLSELFEGIDPLARVVFVYPAVAWVIVLVCLAVLMIVLPPLLRLILGARPMKPGGLRDRLERMADAAGYSGARLFVIPTGTSRLANAFVVGLSARWRYIFFMEAIVEGMSDESLECVLAHEVTHAKKQHILFYFMATLVFSAFSGLIHEGLEWAGVPSSGIYPALLAWGAAFWGLGFGYVSRRFETEADLVAARILPPLDGGFPPYAAARKMAAALQRVADLNNASIWGWAWRHFTIAKRIDILLAAEVNPAVGQGFERVCDRFRRAALSLTILGLACAGVTLSIQKGKAEENRALLRAYDEVEQGRRDLDAGKYEEALEHLRKGIDGGSTSAAAWLWRADAERGLGRTQDAEVSEATAWKKGISDPRLRLRGAP
jgi:Zn-dependent protease with chaperone function